MHPISLLSKPRCMIGWLKARILAWIENLAPSLTSCVILDKCKTLIFSFVTYEMGVMINLTSQGHWELSYILFNYNFYLYSSLNSI